MEVYICLYGSLSSLSRLLFRNNLSRLLFSFNSNNFSLRSPVISVVSTTRESLGLCLSRGISLNFSSSFSRLGFFSLSSGSSSISVVSVASTERSSVLFTFSLSITILLSSTVVESTEKERSLQIKK